MVVGVVPEAAVTNAGDSEPYTPLQSYTSSGFESNNSSSGESGSAATSQSSAASSEPSRFRLLSDVYQETEVVELEDDMLLMSAEEPTTYYEAVKDNEWKKAMEAELDAIEKNKTWVLSDLPKGHKAIGLKWVFKIKKDTNGEIVKHKARLVAKGYVQKQGVDFEEVFCTSHSNGNGTLVA